MSLNGYDSLMAMRRKLRRMTARRVTVQLLGAADEVPAALLALPVVEHRLAKPRNEGVI